MSAPAFLRKLDAVRDADDGTWLTPCPEHASGGFAVVVRKDETQGRYRFLCLEAEGADVCASEGRLLELLGLTQAELHLSPNGLAWERLSDIEMRSIEFADKPLLLANAFHLEAGRKGVGKGTHIADVSARTTRGELGAKRNVVWIASEDSASIDIKPRVLAAGGDPERVFVITDWIQLPRDIEKLGNTIREIGDVGLVIIDPVGNHITGKNSNSETDIRDAIAPLNDLADKHETIVIGVRHLSEKECTNGAIAAILGSSAWVQVPRAVLIVARDNDDARVSHIQCVAGNRLPPETSGRAFRIEGVMLDGLENEVTRAVWIDGPSKNVETLIGESKKEPSKSDLARELILDILEDEGEQESDALDARVARETGLAAKTVRNTRSKLSDEGLLKPVPDKDEFGEIVRWVVRRTQAPRPEHGIWDSPTSPYTPITGSGLFKPNQDGTWEADGTHIPSAEVQGSGTEDAGPPDLPEPDDGPFAFDFDPNVTDPGREDGYREPDLLHEPDREEAPA